MRNTTRRNILKKEVFITFDTKELDGMTGYTRSHVNSDWSFTVDIFRGKL